jgi:hypothetical protein
LSNVVPVIIATNLTVKEYCDQEKIDFEYVWKFLRGK